MMPHLVLDGLRRAMLRASTEHCTGQRGSTAPSMGHVDAPSRTRTRPVPKTRPARPGPARSLSSNVGVTTTASSLVAEVAREARTREALA